MTDKESAKARDATIGSNESNTQHMQMALEQAFPEVQQSFDFIYEELENIKNHCIIALDANVLLFPYKMDSLSLLDIGKVYQGLASKQRLIIPAQAGREYLALRASKIAEITGYLYKESTAMTQPVSKKIGILEEDNDFKKLVETSKEIQNLQKRMRGELKLVAEKLSQASADPVMKLYRQIFKNCIADYIFISSDSRKAFEMEMKERYVSKRPPGFKDAHKEDGGYGDFLIWKTILDCGTKRKMDFVFVTGEEKPDWSTKLGEGHFQPRFELIDEYRRASGGKSIHIISLSSLLRLFEAQKSTVDNVQHYELITEAGKIAMSADDASIQVEATRPMKRVSLGMITQQIFNKEREIEAWQGRIASLPDDPNISLSLPWNRARHGAYSKIGQLEKELVLLRGELALFKVAET